VFDLFLDIFSYHRNSLSRLDPRLKITAALTALVCIMLSRHAYLPLGIFVLCLSCLVVLKVPMKLIFGRFALPMMFVLVLILLQAVAPGRQEGGKTVFQAGFLLGSKVLGGLSVVILLSTVTPAHRIFRALRALGVPDGWVEIALLMYRSIFVLLEHASDGACAQRVRLGYHGLRRTVSSLGTLAGSVLVRSLDQSRQTYEAMQLRGYAGSVPGEPLPRLTVKEVVLTLCACLAVVTLFLIQEWR
jgi:cobalt/nickel transport system permease protein